MLNRCVEAARCAEDRLITIKKRFAEDIEKMNIQLRPDPEVRVEKIKIDGVPALVLRPAGGAAKAPGVLWIHGGGYILGMKEMVHMGRAADLVKKYGAVVIAPGYRLAFMAPYPAALHDCYKSLVYMKKHARELGIRDDQLMVGGESAGGGLAAAVCLLARDMKEVNVAYQMPLYPMLSNIDTESSANNHGRVWNTRRNHIGWRFYLRGKAKCEVPPYAAPAQAADADLAGLPPAYTFVGSGEPFYAETLEYVRRLRTAGVEADVDVYDTNIHAFDMLYPEMEQSRAAIAKFEEHFEYAREHYFAEQKR